MPLHNCVSVNGNLVHGNFREQDVLNHHKIADPYAEMVFAACLGCGSIFVGADEISCAAYAKLVNEADNWCCGFIVVYEPSFEFSARHLSQGMTLKSRLSL